MTGIRVPTDRPGAGPYPRLVLLDPDAENDVAYELCQIVGRAILPYRSSDATDQRFGTAFFFQGTDDPVGESLLTAVDLVGSPGGELGLRSSVTEPAGVAPDAVTETDIRPGWGRFPGDGVAVLPTSGLHRYAGDGGWRWRVQPVPAGIAAGPEVVAGLGADASSAFVLAHGLREDGSRPLEVAIERVVRDGDDVRITTELPPGYVGAPVFVVGADTAGDVSLYCLGLVLPGVGGHPVATFDRIRAVLSSTPGDDSRRDTGTASAG
ncbi:hypothetical protein [Micromonospora sp. U21]|uniref:hypothetical protein n=1 Tax=Micromonospora sp. U21 TaxID=2824899 RepID=UPI001B366863|nr:hypothetical protein [Micromonospora sp. U21]MBQ0901914.1 hypothetical protein [Micromonospora sp. U21]